MNQQTIEQLQACKSSTWHLMHFILTVVFIPWAAVWIYCAWSNSKHNKNIDAHIVMLQNNNNVEDNQ